MTSGASLARAGIIVSGAFLASRTLGWVRISATTAIFGATPELDAFFAAFRIPDLMYQLVAAGALGSALVPVVAGLLANDERARAWRLVSIVANLVLIALLTLSLAFALAAPVIVPVITPGFDPAQTELTVTLTRMMLLGPVFLALGSVASSLLNASGRFTAAAVAPITYNLGILGFAVLLGPRIGVAALALGVVAGSLGHLLIQLPAIVRGTGYRYRPVADLRDASARTVFGLMAPRALGLGAVQITFVVNTTLASGLGTGAITAYQVAFTILQLPLGLIAQPLGIVLLPAMSRAVATGHGEDFASLVDRSLRLLAYAMLFVTSVGIVLRREIVTLLFGYGRFDAPALALTSDTLLVFLVGLPAHSLIAIMARAFYAHQDTRTPVGAALLAVVINVAVSVLTVGALGLAGLALGIAAGAWAEAILLLALLRRAAGGPLVLRELAAWGRFAGLAAVAGAGAAVVLVVLGRMLGPGPSKPLVLLEAAAATLVAAGVYTVASRLLRLPELPAILRIAGGAVARRRPA